MKPLETQNRQNLEKMIFRDPKHLRDLTHLGEFIFLGSAIHQNAYRIIRLLSQSHNFTTCLLGYAKGYRLSQGTFYPFSPWPSIPIPVNN